MSDQKKLSDAQYVRLQPLLPPPSNHLKIPHRQVLDAWLYVLYQGCTWRGLPREFGNWHTIYVRLNRWAKAGVLERAAAELQREALADMGQSSTQVVAKVEDGRRWNLEPDLKGLVEEQRDSRGCVRFAPIAHPEP